MACRLLPAVAIAAGLIVNCGTGQARVPPPGEFPNQRPDDYKFSVSIGPSFFAPRMHRLNDALTSEGFEYMGWTVNTYDLKIPRGGSGFPRAGMGYGAQVSLKYEFDEELRGGLSVDLAALSASGESSFFDISPVMSGTITVGSSVTTYVTSHKTSLPLIRIGASIDKVFHLENSPKLKLYVGGWGCLGLLVSARITGDVRQEAWQSGVALDNRGFSITLRGQGWGVGGLGGAEYQISRWVKFYGEAGFDYFVIENVESTGEVEDIPIGARSFRTTAGGQIPLDYSGVFIRFGVKTGLGG